MKQLSLLARARKIQETVTQHYEKECRAKCLRAVWKHHVEEEFGINYHTFLPTCIRIPRNWKNVWSRKGLDAPYSMMYDKNEPASYRRTEQHSGIPYDRSYRTQRKTKTAAEPFSLSERSRNSSVSAFSRTICITLCSTKSCPEAGS